MTVGIMRSLFSPDPVALPIKWDAEIGRDGHWVGYIGNRFSGFKLFHVERGTYIECGTTYCLHSKLSDCVYCLPTLEEAQEKAATQWRDLVKQGVIA